MKMKYKLIAVALMAGAAQAALADTTPYMGLQGTYGWQADARHTSDAIGGTILFGFPTSEYFAPEINLFGLQSDRDGTSKRDREYGGGLDFAIYPMQRSSAFSPFLLLGGGAQYEDRAANEHTYGFANAGGGFLISLNQAHTVAIRVDAKHYWVFDNDSSSHDYLQDTRINAGVQFVLGKKAAEPAAPPPPPQPKDSDGDGVIDSLDQCPGRQSAPRLIRVVARCLHRRRQRIAMAMASTTTSTPARTRRTASRSTHGAVRFAKPRSCCTTSTSSSTPRGCCPARRLSSTRSPTV